MSKHTAIHSGNTVRSPRSVCWGRTVKGAAISLISASLATVTPEVALSSIIRIGVPSQAAGDEIARQPAADGRIGFYRSGKTQVYRDDHEHPAAILIAEKRSSRGLAGSEGDVRKKFVAFFGGSDHLCTKMYEKYVAAPGHSAFAATAYVWGAESIMCSYAANAPSKKTAEDAALASCNKGFSHHKDARREVVGKCEIYASK